MRKRANRYPNPHRRRVCGISANEAEDLRGLPFNPIPRLEPWL